MTCLSFVTGSRVAVVVNTDVVELVFRKLDRRPMQTFKPKSFLIPLARSMRHKTTTTYLARFISNPITVILSGHLPVISLNLANENNTFSNESSANSSVVAR